MTFIPKALPKRVKLLRELETSSGKFTKGHEFKVIGDGYRGYDLEDDEGNQVRETCFIFDTHFKVIA